MLLVFRAAQQGLERRNGLHRTQLIASVPPSQNWNRWTALKRYMIIDFIVIHIQFMWLCGNTCFWIVLHNSVVTLLAIAYSIGGAFSFICVLQQGHVGSKTLHQQNPPVPIWRYQLIQVDLYNGCKMVAAVVSVSVCLSVYLSLF